MKKLKSLQMAKESKSTEVVGELNENSDKVEESDAESKSRGSIHPLLVDHILENIFKLVIDPIRKNGRQNHDVGAISRDVQSFRLVCKTWSVVATNVFRKARPLMDIGGEKIKECPDRQFGRFLETMRDSSMIPVRSYKINRSVLTSQNSQLMKLFLEICGPEMVELHVAICANDLNSRLVIPGDVSHLKLEKLSTLKISVQPDYNPYPSHQENGDVAEFIGFLLSVTENLKDFTMSYYENVLHGQLLPKGVVKFFKKVPSTLKSVKLRTNYSDFYLNTLLKNDVKLETFEYGFGYFSGEVSRDCEDAIYAFFDGQSQTLKNLIVPTVCLTVKPESEKPIIFSRLSSLGLRMEHLPLSFSDRFPKLTVLDLRFCFGSELDCMELLSVTAPTESVTELRLPFTFLGASTAKKIAKCFPNVRKLVHDLSEGKPNPFRHVFVYFPKIEELEIFVHPKKICRIERGRILLPWKHYDMDLLGRIHKDLIASDVQENPSILLLKELKKLILRTSQTVVRFPLPNEFWLPFHCYL